MIARILAWLLLVLVVMFTIHAGRRLLAQRREITVMNRVAVLLAAPAFRYRSDDEALAVVYFVRHRDWDAALKILETEREYT